MAASSNSSLSGSSVSSGEFSPPGAVSPCPRPGMGTAYLWPSRPRSGRGEAGQRGTWFAIASTSVPAAPPRPTSDGQRWQSGAPGVCGRGGAGAPARRASGAGAGQLALSGAAGAEAGGAGKVGAGRVSGAAPSP